MRIDRPRRGDRPDESDKPAEPDRTAQAEWPPAGLIERIRKANADQHRAIDRVAAPDRASENETKVDWLLKLARGDKATAGNAGDAVASDAPQRPQADSIRLEDNRRAHLLDGDATGGGHRSGTGLPGKTEFPARWSDDVIVDNVMKTARTPEREFYTAARGYRPEQWRCERYCDGVTVVAIVRPDTSVHAAWPLPGGQGVVQNPRGDPS